MVRSYECLSFIRPEHLDISSTLIRENMIQVAGNRKAYEELRQINTYTSPREKLIAISNCFRIINRKLK